MQIDLKTIFGIPLRYKNHVYLLQETSENANQSQTNISFSNKWGMNTQRTPEEQEKAFAAQKNWYLQLYGFNTESALANFLRQKNIILDAGSGLGYKAKWFADLSPNSLVIGMDFSEAVFAAAETYKDTGNLIFIKGDISDTKIIDASIDYVSCDQVIHHTSNPEKTAIELSRILKRSGELAVYVYAKNI